MRIGDLYRANQGRGHYFARVVAIDGDCVELEMFRGPDVGVGRVTSFHISASYLTSAVCTWKPVAPPDDAELYTTVNPA